VTRSAKLLISVALVAAAAAAYWMLVLSPKREQITKLDTEITQQEAAAAQAEQMAASYQKAKDNYRANYTKVARLGKAVPADDDVRSLLVQLDSTAKRAKVSFSALTVSGGGSAPAASGSGATATASATPGKLAPPPGAVPVGSAGFSAMPFSFKFTGSFFRLSDFFTRLERFVTVQNDNIDVTGRLLLIGSISITPESGTEGDIDKLSAQVGAASYLVPETEGVTGGATPSAPAPSTPASTAPAGGDSSSSTTTATTTGVQ
jgi:Tfp pilus assembly protein PilO